MNLLYEKLITAFLDKAKIERDANQIAHVLKNAYPNATLPNAKTVKRFLTGETHHPRDTFLGFLAAFVLNKTDEEVVQADKNSALGVFYDTFLSQLDKEAPSVKTAESAPTQPEMPRKDDETKMAVWILCAAVMLLSGYIVSLSKTQTPPANIQFPTMITLKGNTYLRGDTFDDTKTEDDEKPCRRVWIDSFNISQTEITFDLFDAFCKSKDIPLKSDLSWGRAHRPAIMVSWYEAVEFCNWLSELQGFTPVYTIKTGENGQKNVSSNLNNNGYRLPTEAEWEYAAAVDVKTNVKYRFGHHDNAANAEDLNYDFEKKYSAAGKIFHRKTVPVMESGLNRNGLYGMVGNVAEWCHDYYHPHFYRDNRDSTNPIAASFVKDSSYVHVLRGGDWEATVTKVRATFRESAPADAHSETFGFRVVRRNGANKIGFTSDITVILSIFNSIIKP
jgi:formylglycine-generating enzyme required for sulfatase activity